MGREPPPPLRTSPWISLWNLLFLMKVEAKKQGYCLSLQYQNYPQRCMMTPHSQLHTTTTCPPNSQHSHHSQHSQHSQQVTAALR